jgi:GGDEF domain-containing protein
LAALSVRQKLPLSCVVFRVPERDIAASDGDRVAGAFKSEGRVSDAIGRTGPNEFTVFAPATDGAAVVRLVNRLGDTVARRARLDHPMQSGSASATEATGLDPRDLLERARRSLDAT